MAVPTPPPAARSGARTGKRLGRRVMTKRESVGRGDYKELLILSRLCFPSGVEPCWGAAGHGEWGHSGNGVGPRNGQGTADPGCHSDHVTSVGWSRDGKRLALASTSKVRTVQVHGYPRPDGARSAARHRPSVRRGLQEVIHVGRCSPVPELSFWLLSSG